MFWKQKSKKQKLRDRYNKLMKKAFEVASKNREKSKYFHEKAEEVLYQIKRLNLNKLH